RGAQPEASTASEGSGPMHAEEPGNPRRTMPSNRTKPSFRNPFASGGVGDGRQPPHEQRRKFPRARSAAGGEHRKRGFRSDARRRPRKPRTNNAVESHQAVSRNTSASGGVGDGRQPPHEPRRKSPRARSAAGGEHRKRGFRSDAR